MTVSKWMAERFGEVEVEVNRSILLWRVFHGCSAFGRRPAVVTLN